MGRGLSIFERVKERSKECVPLSLSMKSNRTESLEGASLTCMSLQKEKDWSKKKFFFLTMAHLGFPDGSAGKESACNAGDLGSSPGSGRSPGERNGNLLQYSCLENSR